jgi:hypothetical protein
MISISIEMDRILIILKKNCGPDNTYKKKMVLIRLMIVVHQSDVQITHLD